MGIPFTLLGVLIIYFFIGMDLDSITLLSMVIVIGIIVDDAIIISENIFQRRAKGDAPLDAAVNGLHEVYRPVLTTITTTFLVFLPMFFMKGILGKFVFVIPLTISLALFMSLFESFFVLPAHLMPSLKMKKEGKGQTFGRAWFDPVRDWFEKFAHYVLRLRYALVLIAVLILAGSLFYAATSMNFILFPTKGSEAFFALIELPTGSSLQATSDQVKKFEAILDSMPDGEIESYAFRVGTNYTTEVENNAILTANLTAYGTRQRIADEIVIGGTSE